MLSLKLEVIKHVWYALIDYFGDLGMLKNISTYINGNCALALPHSAYERFDKKALLLDTGETCI